LTRSEAQAELVRLAAAPVALSRPVVILAGWRAPRIAAWSLQQALVPATSGKNQDFHSIAYPGAGSIEAAAEVARRALAARGLAGASVDVVGISMGGLVARHLAAEGGVLRAHRLFTIATPHRGATLAKFVRVDQASADMRPGSEALARLDAQTRDLPCELICYAGLNDWWVGAKNTAPPGHVPLWVEPETVGEKLFSHFTMNRAPTILADLARRLRGEAPLGEPGPPPPRD
jgi:pimeloyl-ACP methyl ester carboxylesterase